jgi:hypothetical protein
MRIWCVCGQEWRLYDLSKKGSFGEIRSSLLGINEKRVRGNNRPTLVYASQHVRSETDQRTRSVCHPRWEDSSRVNVHKECSVVMCGWRYVRSAAPPSEELS